MDIEAYKRFLMKEGYSPLTIRKYVNLLNSIDVDLDTTDPYLVAEYLYNLPRTIEAKNNLAKAINSYYRFRNNAFRLKLRPKRGADIWVPSEAQKNRVLSATWENPVLNARNRLFLRVLFETGIRVSEAIKLQFNNVHRRGDQYYITVTGKNNKVRQVPITPQLYATIWEYRDTYAPHHKYIFYSLTDPTKHITDKTARKICKQAGHQAGVPQFHPHAARHYRAIQLIEAGVSLETIRRLLGHSTLNTTQIYLRGTTTIIQKELQQKDPLFKQPRGGAKK